jgi:hypothetical protein
LNLRRIPMLLLEWLAIATVCIWAFIEDLWRALSDYES